MTFDLENPKKIRNPERFTKSRSASERGQDFGGRQLRIFLLICDSTERIHSKKLTIATFLPCPALPCPEDTDVLVTHAPCWGILDLTVGGDRVGSWVLKE
jgi:hypothetical protein